MTRKSMYKKNDPNYLNTKAQEPKEAFKLMRKIIGKRYKRQAFSLIDVGCASGAFINYITQELNISACSGVDISEKHLALAKKQMPHITWIKDSLLKPKKMHKSKYDVCTIFGTLAIFNDLRIVLKNLTKLIKPNGTLYIFEFINDDPIDLVEKHRRVTSSRNGPWETALNLWSLQTYKNNLKGFKIKTYDFKMPFAIAKTLDPLRAWTIETKSNKHQVIVGTSQLLNFKILEIYKE